MNFTRVACVVPEVHIANVLENVKEIKNGWKTAVDNGANVILFPELCLTGYTCADIFSQSGLLKTVEPALYELVEMSKEGRYWNTALVVGFPYNSGNQLFNCAALIANGAIKGIVPKSYLPTYNEFYERRWFSEARDANFDKVEICNQSVPFGTDIIFQGQHVSIFPEICEDVWVPIPPSTYAAMNGANLILNLSASNEIVAKPEYREMIVKAQSAKCIAAYAYCSAGSSESTTDLVFSGHSMIVENGTILAKTRREETSVIYADIDAENLMHDRKKQTTYMTGDLKPARYIKIEIGCIDKVENTIRKVKRNPFVPDDKSRYEEILNLQATGLYRRLKNPGGKPRKAIIGISGGLDSTLALLVSYEAYKKLGMGPENIIGITMPGFGTTNRTYNNAIDLMRALKVTMYEKSIKEECLLHYKLIGQDENNHDITYENVQARLRTSILMNMANKEGGLVVGTGDLSELALGWCTYNGDHMSMYAVNSSVPKTLVKYIIEAYAMKCDEKIKNILLDILDTPISPELLPAGKDGEILQKTEEKIGKYDLNDFFLYHLLRFGESKEKMFELACIAYPELSKEKIAEAENNFLQRFFTQQFKRSCLPDGPKVGSVCLSPRGDFRCPSDAAPYLV